MFLEVEKKAAASDFNKCLFIQPSLAQCHGSEGIGKYLSTSTAVCNVENVLCTFVNFLMLTSLFLLYNCCDFQDEEEKQN